MSNSNQYNFSRYTSEKYKLENIFLKNQSKSPHSAVVRINPKNLNNYQQIIKNDQISKNESDINKQNKYNIELNLNNYNTNNNNKFLENIFIKNIKNPQTKNFILKIKSDEIKENIYKLKLKQDNSADRVIEPQRQIITADVLAKRRMNLNRSLNLKITKTHQMYSATNRNDVKALLGNNNENNEKFKQKEILNNNYDNNLTINKRQLITPINYFNYNPSCDDNRNLFSPVTDKNHLPSANQTHRKMNNILYPILGNNRTNQNNNIINNVNINLYNNNNTNSHTIQQIIPLNYNTINTPSSNKERIGKYLNSRTKEKNDKELNYNNIVNINNEYKTNFNLFNEKNNFNLIENNNFNFNENKHIGESKNLYNPSAKSVKEYSYNEDQNDSFRENMEDYSKIIDKYMNDNNKGLFCLFDGHGGSDPVKYVCDRLPETFSKFLFDTKNNIEKSLINTFQKLDDEIKLLPDTENVGTTALIIYILKDTDLTSNARKIIYCANVGDSRCILLNNTGFKRLSYDHKCTDESEAARIRKVGGIVFNGRVFGQLALSRALGDHAMKKYGVICLPNIVKHLISQKDRFIVLCSDGVWDVLSDEDVYNLSMKVKNSCELSTLIVNTAIDKGSRDNISCIVIRIN